MIRKTVLGLAAAATLAVAMATSASTASAGAKIHFSVGVPAYGYGYGYHTPYAHVGPVYGYYSCRNVIVGYKKVHTHKGWKKRPIYRRHCGY
jgi:hypothetical protein